MYYVQEQPVTLATSLFFVRSERPISQYRLSFLHVHSGRFARFSSMLHTPGVCSVFPVYYWYITSVSRNDLWWQQNDTAVWHWVSIKWSVYLLVCRLREILAATRVRTCGGRYLPFVCVPESRRKKRDWPLLAQQKARHEGWWGRVGEEPAVWPL